MIKAKDVSWLALMGALAIAPLGAVAYGADSTTAPSATTTAPAPALDTAAGTTGAADTKNQKGSDVTVVDPSAHSAQGTLAELVPGQMTAEDLIGKSVVNSEGKTIGSITDIVLDKDRAVYAVMSVGGFLGIGADYVAVPFEKIQFNTAQDGTSKVQLVANVTAADLKKLARDQQRAETTSEAGRSKPAASGTDLTGAADSTAGTAAPAAPVAPAAPATVATDTSANGSSATPPADTGTAGTGTLATDNTGAAQPQVAAAYANVTAEDLIGKSVVNNANETVGKIDDLVIDNQKVVMAVISVGGFLGIGAKDVAVPLEQLQLSQDRAVLTSGLSKDDLKKMPAYEKGRLQDLGRGKPIYGTNGSKS